MPTLPLTRQLATRGRPPRTDLRLVLRPREPDPPYLVLLREEKWERRVECPVLRRGRGD